MILKDSILILNQSDCRNIRSWMGCGCTALEALRSEIHLARINFADVMMLKANEETDLALISYLNHEVSQLKISGEYVS